MRTLFYTRLVLSSVFKTTAAALLAAPAYHYVQGNLTPRPLPDGMRADAVIALTGKEDRIPLAYEAFSAGQGDRFFVSGPVYDTSWPPLASIDPIDRETIFVNDAARSTIDNGLHTAQWIAAHHVQTAVFHTSGNHIARAHFEINRLLPDTVALYYQSTSVYEERAFPDTEKMRLLCRLYETSVGIDFCYAARDLWNDPAGFMLRFQHTPPAIAGHDPLNPG